MTGQRTSKEEIWNSITHLFGFVVCFFYLLDGGVGTKILSLFMMMTFAFSVLYHSSPVGAKKDYFRMLDMASVHISAAGTSIAYSIQMDGGFFGCAIPIIVGACGCQYVLSLYGKEIFEKTAVLACITTGVLCLFCVVCIQDDSNSIIYFILGCLTYLFGLFFYVRENKQFYHTIWHVFVLFATYIHILGTM